MPTVLAALLACCLADLSRGDLQVELSMVVPTAMDVGQLLSDILSAARNATILNETVAPFDPHLSAQVVAPPSDILCILGVFCFENSQYTYLQTPTPTPAPPAEASVAWVAVAVGGFSALALAGVLLLFCCRPAPEPRKRTVIRATIDWPPGRDKKRGLR